MVFFPRANSDGTVDGNQKSGDQQRLVVGLSQYLRRVLVPSQGGWLAQHFWTINSIICTVGRWRSVMFFLLQLRCSFFCRVFSIPLVFKKSPEQWPVDPVHLLYKGGEILPSYIGIIMNHCKDPYKAISIVECHKGFWTLLTYLHS